jgi:tetratricopeptide (TPR) repeat protein
MYRGLHAGWIIQPQEDTMTKMLTLTGGAALALLMLQSVFAHDGDEAGGKPDEQIGRVEFGASCRDEANHELDRALALYHSFWFEPANAAYRKVLQRDPECGMAYWGLALSALGNPFAWPAPSKAVQSGAAFMAEAQRTSAKSERERGFISALSLLFRDWETTEHRARSLAWGQAMEQLAARFPEDTETQIFHALTLVANAQASDKTFVNQLKAGAILEPLLQQRADHPGVAHYLIHAYDFSGLVERGLPAARRYAAVAPSAPHALHMPAHIFTRLGMWEESIETNRVSAKAAKDELKGTTHAIGSYNAIHAMDYMMYAYLQRAQDGAAGALVREIEAIERIDATNFPVAYALAAMPARFALERRRWDDAARLQLLPKEFSWKQFPQAEAVLVYARALGASRTGAIAQASLEVDRLRQLLGEMKAMKLSYWAQQTEIQVAAASAWLALAQGRTDDALNGMQQAAELEDRSDKHPVTPGPLVPVHELLGEMLLELKRPAEALEQFERVQTAEPNRFRAIYCAARAAELAGDGQKALTLYDRLLTLVSKRDGERPEIAHAQRFLRGG